MKAMSRINDALDAPMRMQKAVTLTLVTALLALVVACFALGVGVKNAN